MAFEQGTATDHVDLYNKLYTFLTSHPDLVSVGQQWERVPTVGLPPPWTEANPSSNTGHSSIHRHTDLMLKGPGLAGQDEIFVSMRLAYLSSIDRAGIYIRGHSGVDPGQDSYSAHVNTSRHVMVPLWSQSAGYWFVANGRRFVAVIKRGTRYFSFYAGLYLPYALPSGNPYPIMVGGSSPDVSIEDVGVDSIGAWVGMFADPWRTNTSRGSQLQVMGPEGTWSTFLNGADYDSASIPGVSAYRTNGVHPFGSALFPRALSMFGSSSGGGTPPGWGRGYRYLRNAFILAQRPLLGGGYLLTPLTLLSSNFHTPDTVPSGVWGIMDGVFFVPGQGNTSENIVQVAGVDHLVVQNVYRVRNDCYFALALE